MATPCRQNSELDTSTNGRNETKQNLKSQLNDYKKRDRNAHIKSSLCHQTLTLGRSAASDLLKPTKTSAVESIINNGSELGLSEDSEDEVSWSYKAKRNESVQKANIRSQNMGTSQSNQRLELNDSKDNGQFLNLNKPISQISNYSPIIESIQKNRSESVTKMESTCKSAISVFSLSEDLAVSSDSDSDLEVYDMDQNMSTVNPRKNPNDTYVKGMPQSATAFGYIKPLTSPMAKSTDGSESDTSGTDESSTADSESEEDKPTWNLDVLFNDKKFDSTYHHEVSQKELTDAGNKQSPLHHLPEVVSTVVATVPKHRKRTVEERSTKSKNLLNLSSDDSSDEEQPVRRPTPKAQKLAGSRYPSTYKVAKVKHTEPILSSESEDDVAPSRSLPPTRKPSTPKANNSKNSQSLSKSPRTSAVPVTNKYRKKPEGKRKESEKLMKSKEYLPSDEDSDCDPDPVSYSNSKNKVVPPSISDRSSCSTRPSPRQKSVAAAEDSRNKESYTKTINKPKTSSELKSEMKLKVSMPISREQIENLKPQKVEKAEKKRKSRSDNKNDKENKNEKENRRNDKESRIKKEMKNENVPESVHSRLEPPPPSVVRGSPLHKNNLADQVQYENGIAQVLCSIPISLIDSLPSVKSEDKVNKEVIEMRTSGGAKKKNNKSPPNEDNKKLAIWSIYKHNKRPSSVESDKTKRDNKSEDSCKIKSEDNQPIKTEIKLEEKPKLDVAIKPESNLKRQGSNSSLSSSTTQDTSSNYKIKRRKKDKRKERSSSRDNSKDLSCENDKATERKKQLSPDVELVTGTRKRTKDSSRHEDVRGEESSSHRTKKAKCSPEVEVPSPSRLMNDERPSSSMSGENCSRRSKKSSQLLDSKTYESEEEPSSVEDSSQFRNKQGIGEEAVPGTSGHSTDYQYLPPFEHESRNGGDSNFRPGPSPIPVETTPSDMYPPNAHSEYTSYNPQQPYDSIGSRQSTLRYLPTTWGDRKPPDVRKDYNTYLKNAIELKHKADAESHNRTLQTVMYLEAVLYFILTGESSVADSNAFKMFNDTLLLIRHVSSLFRRDNSEGPNKINVILIVLSLRCQSLLSLKSYSMRRNEFMDSYKYLTEYTKHFEKTAGQVSTPCSGNSTAATAGAVGTPNLPHGWSQRSAGANNSPSSPSPTPSPSDSVGSDVSQSSSGYSTEGNRQLRLGCQPGLTTPPSTVGVPVDIHTTVIKYYNISHSLSQAFEMWNEADELVQGSDQIKEFFVSIDKHMGPLTFHSSLRKLVPYVQEALEHLKRMTSQQPEVTCSTKAPSGVK